MPHYHKFGRANLLADDVLNNLAEAGHVESSCHASQAIVYLRVGQEVHLNTELSDTPSATPSRL